MYKLLLISILFFVNLLAYDNTVKSCDNKNLNKLCIDKNEIQANNIISDITYTNSELSFLYNINNENQPFLSKVVIKNLDGDTTTQIIDSTSSEKYFNIIYTFDTNSLLLSESISGSDIDTRVTKYEHGMIDGNYAIKTINPLNQIEINIYDTNNNLVKQIDINGLETVYLYDDSHRIIKKIEPNNIVTIFSYSTSDLVPNSSYKMTQITENEPTIIKFFDNNDKVITTYTEGFDGRYIVTELTENYFPYFKGDSKYASTSLGDTSLDNNNLEYEYNCLGYKIKTIDTESLKTTYYTYDLLNRITKEKTIKNDNLDNTQIIYYIYDRGSYGAGKLSYIKSDTYKKEFFYNELSQVKATKEYIGNKVFSNQYFYSSTGKLEKTITPNGFEIINEYNKFGYLSAVKTPRTIKAEFNIDNVKTILESNLKGELNIFKQYLDLKTKVKIYSLKRTIYDELSVSYTDQDIKQKLEDIVILLDKTITLLNKIILESEKALESYRNITENYILPQIIETNGEITFQNLSKIFQEKSDEYIVLSTTYLDMANTMLEEIIRDPELLNDTFSHHKELILHYKNISSNSIDIANRMTTLSNNYWTKYLDIKNGNEQTTITTYTGMFDNPDYKYFYKILGQNALSQVIQSISGNGVVTTNEYEPSNNKISRVTIGYYGKDDIKDVRYDYNDEGKLIKLYDVKKSFTTIFDYNDGEQLQRAINIGANYYTNISYDYGTQDIYQYDQNNDLYQNTSNNVKVNTSKTYDIQDNNITISSSYSPNKLSYEKTISAIDNNSSKYYKIGKNFKYNVNSTTTTYKNLIYANDTLVALNIQNEIENFTTPINYYIHNDIDGSLDIITNEAALVEKKIYYRPYGQLTDNSWVNIANVNNITNIGYKGFEHDLKFNLIDINSYVYDPNYAKVLTKDIFNNPLKTEDMTQSIKSLTTFPNTIISETAPEDITKAWYRPDDINGGMDIFVYKDGEWIALGTTGNLTQNGRITVQSLNELTPLSCFEGDKGFVSLTNSNNVAYKCNDSNSWDLGGSFEGVYNISDLATTYFNALDGTSIVAVSSNGEFVGEKTFIKNGNYWVDSSNSYYVFNSLDTILSSSVFAVGNVVFFPENSTSYYSLTRHLLETLGEKWIYNASLGEVIFNSSEIVNAIPKVDIVSMYNDAPSVAVVGNQLFLKELDTLNRTIYKRADGKYLSKNSAIIPDSYKVGSIMSLPPAYDASTVTINSEKVILDNRTQVIEWDDAPNGVQIEITGISETYTHIVDNTIDFWTNNASEDGQLNATEIFTKGSRSNFPTITHSIIALTKQVGSEPSYTGTGVVSTIDGDFKQWFYSLSGTIVNNLLDNPCLIRNKDGLSLEMDSSTLTCYVQKATNSQKYASISVVMGKNHLTTTADTWNPSHPDTCYSSYQTPNWLNIGESSQSFHCVLWKIVYTADSGWVKLDDSTQEYRESF